ncbi:hypothetical protein C7B82_17485 [Stenomitos frigidus ULC18]|uniref:Uncharacterized protein n=2 Tax=Stenomitos TaxID=1844270 RepID=A0A2T1E2V8_9CYAN|nr:hypothetical protein C7B82_17485 [Stenomitos frigidus ULC18]
MRFRWLVRVAIAAALITSLTQHTVAQTKTRSGVLLLNQVRELSTRSTTLSGGKLVDLETDPNFTGGAFPAIVNDAATILANYTVVRRGGYFPENRGIPRERQLTVVEAVYRIYSLPNGSELFLYRTPTENTAEYFIRKKS